MSYRGIFSIWKSQHFYINNKTQAQFISFYEKSNLNALIILCKMSYQFQTSGLVFIINIKLMMLVYSSQLVESLANILLQHTLLYPAFQPDAQIVKANACLHNLSSVLGCSYAQEFQALEPYFQHACSD